MFKVDIRLWEFHRFQLSGQRNIKLVADFVKNKGFKIKYGDTNSLYLVCPEEYFQECDTAYDNGNGISKEKYW